jgi:hypothetical protein
MDFGQHKPRLLPKADDSRAADYIGGIFNVEQFCGIAAGDCYVLLG